MKRMQRSNAPIYWALFGGGGTLSSLFGPALIFVTGLAVPLGLLAAGTLDYAYVLAFAQHFIGKAFLFAVIMLFAWHAVHRVYKSLHDFGIHPGPLPWLACYGSASVVSVLAAMGLLRIGF